MIFFYFYLFQRLQNNGDIQSFYFLPIVGVEYGAMTGSFKVLSWPMYTSMPNYRLSICNKHHKQRWLICQGLDKLFKIEHTLFCCKFSVVTMLQSLWVKVLTTFKHFLELFCEFLVYLRILFNLSLMLLCKNWYFAFFL